MFHGSKSPGGQGTYVEPGEEEIARVHVGNGGGGCIEVDDAHPGRVRDSKDPQGPTLVFPTEAWRSFVCAVQAGEFGEV
ncbi:DUF397 domain-containing protein [Kitasatospora sp. NPDC001660]